MPSPNPTVRRQHSGNAKTTTLSAPIVNGTDTSFTITDATGWPDGSVGNFVVTINAGQSDVEKILCSTRSGTTVNVAQRGFDSTTAAGHAVGATAAHTISATEVDEANAHTAASSGVHGVAGSVVGTSDSQTLTNKTLTSPTINSGTINTPTVTAPVIQPSSAAGIGFQSQGLTGQTGALAQTKHTDAAATGRHYEALDPSNVTIFAVEHDGTFSGSAPISSAWTSFSPAIVNATGPAVTAAYKLVGKTLHVRVVFTAGTAASTAIIQVQLPASLQGSLSAGTQYLAGPTGGASALWSVASGGSQYFSTFANVTSGASLVGAGFNGTIEVA